MRGVELDMVALAAFCRRWKIDELSLFGSAVRGELRPDSDLDFLASFARDAEWSLFDHVRMEDELSGIVGRDVDIVSKRAVEASHNPVRRRDILGSAERVYGER